MILIAWIAIKATADGGLSSAAIYAVLFYYASAFVGGIAILVGIAAAIFARPRILGIIGIVFGAVPIVAVAAAFAAGAV